MSSINGVSSSTYVDETQSNSQIVKHVDPENPVIAQTAQDSSQSFMQLMIAQLQNQDPMDPMDSNAFTQQLAAINSLEQLISINSLLKESLQSSQLSEATALLGTYVEGLDGENSVVTGYVDNVKVVEGEAKLVVGDSMLGLDEVFIIDELSPADEEYLYGLTGGTDTTDGGA
ncbi:hypothetical protein JW859_00500 [bacterium]|nr:hypothetical protein [bacterium]